ncbi:XRE family transcriptional regulator [Crossiella sp. CA-258035]|uniref:XRE family transcriptional regulator n=1 Tax=Crossiella sp. CA-258035 TaxID=2981138 RepID=UPI0024BCCCA7|nr:XRE family transcriptional regulator [Crossiella sp. CA-258035]WHT21894.1 XRE family transcriptional regulator [Crossiella sp. CA-258035]
MAKDWAAVSRAITTRMEELGLKQAEVKARSGLALQTVRELQLNLTSRDRPKRTLAAMSEALEWPSDHLSLVLEGKDPGEAAGSDLMVPTLRAVVAEFKNLRDIVERHEAELVELRALKAAIQSDSAAGKETRPDEPR